jgi:pyridinium-3,5-bisthiocarboxylic acid mononucleotide nickel chelatase
MPPPSLNEGLEAVRIAYFDCFSGISGDMILGALIHAGVDARKVADAVASLGLPAELKVARIRKSGFDATQVTVEAPHEHVHRHLHHITRMVDASRLNERQKELAHRIFRRLAEAEAAVHGTTVEKVHFHEVGAVDSIVDIVGAAVAIDLLSVDRIMASPVVTGRGTVRAAHGLMPVPAPGTAELLKGVPLATSTIEAELTTPTGAAILTSIASEFGPLPEMCIESIGLGAGQRDLPDQPNVLRVLVGTAVAGTSVAQTDHVWVLETNLDDLPGELIGYCTEQLLAAGALDVFTIPIGMKKNRPGVLLSVLCAESSIGQMEDIMFRETSTFGIRRTRATRSKLERRSHEVTTPFGPVRGKLGWRSDRPPLFAPEYEDCRRVATERGVALREVYAAAIRAFDPNTVER